jgi:hypothetical protein
MFIVGLSEADAHLELQAGHDGDRLERVKALLDLQTYSPDDELELLTKYESHINEDFDRNWPYLERMQGNRLEELKTHPDFQKWRLSIHSCMLVLVGYNNDSVWSARDCWLSPLALNVITNLKKPGQADPCAFHIIGLGEQPEPFPRILLCIVFQLLKLNAQALHKRDGSQYANLCTAIREYREAVAKAGDESQKYSGETSVLLQKVALGVLNMFDSTKTVWIILDRVDRCEAALKTNHRKKLLQRLVYLVEKAEVKVRVLAVVNGCDWRVDEEGDELGHSIPVSLIIHTERQQMQQY